MRSAPPSVPTFVDTHCHLDAAEFDRDRDAVRRDAAIAGVAAIVIPAVAVSNFAAVARLAHTTTGGHYALGIHPLATPAARPDDIAALRRAVTAALDDPRFVAIGEIGLDRFVPALITPEAFERQTWFLDAQLRIARDFDLPVLLHVRRAQDAVLAALRRVRRGRGDASATGIAHAFNGSRQQADHYRALGFKLGLGGASTFERALRIRALARDLPADAIVLETDAPDIAPAWLRGAGAATDGAHAAGAATAANAANAANAVRADAASDAADPAGPSDTADKADTTDTTDTTDKTNAPNAPNAPNATARGPTRPSGRNAPGELPRIAATIAALRGVDVACLAAETTRNAHAVLPRMTAAVPVDEAAAGPSGRPTDIAVDRP